MTTTLFAVPEQLPVPDPGVPAGTLPTLMEMRGSVGIPAPRESVRWEVPGFVAYRPIAHWMVNVYRNEFPPEAHGSVPRFGFGMNDDTNTLPAKMVAAVMNFSPRPAVGSLTVHEGAPAAWLQVIPIPSLAASVLAMKYHARCVIGVHVPPEVAGRGLVTSSRFASVSVAGGVGLWSKGSVSLIP